MPVEEKEIFFGEKGLVLLRCIDAAGYAGMGDATCAKYVFALDDVRYVDKRDMPKMPKEKFEKAVS